MNERRTASGTLNVRVLLSVVFILGVILTMGPASLVRPVSTTAQEEASFPPEGDWYTYANGDDILVLELEGDILWAGTRAGGLVRWNTTDGTFIQFLKPQDPLLGNSVRDIYIDANGHKWLATDYGLSVLDDKGTPDKTDDDWYAYTRETTNGNPSTGSGHGLPSDRVTAVAVDDSGFLWIGTSQYWDNEAMLDIGGDEPVLAQAYVGGGLVKVDTKGTLDPTDDEWLQTYTVANTADMSSCSQSELVLGLASDNITDILPVAGDRIWVATQKHFAFSAANANNACAFLLANPNDPGRWVQILGGLSRLDHAGTPGTEDDTWRTWTCEEGPQRDAGVSCTINHLKLDANGYVWAAMRSKGVIAFPYDGDRGLNYVRFDKFDGLASNDVESLAFGPPDDPQSQNTVWMGTYHATSGYGRGVSVLDHNGTIRNKDDDKWNDRNQNPIPGSPITTENG
ncbi:MAG: two-component regulator propeller domain-containing protein, partial [Anaerolineae bacterium]